MNDDQREIICLKKLVKAQDKMIQHYRVGKSSIPEWVFKAIQRAKNMYEVNNISDIK